MKHMYFLCVLAIGMIACTEQNTPSGDGSNEGSNPTDTTITTTDTIATVWDGNKAVVTGAYNGVSIDNQNGYVTVTSTVKDTAISYLLSGEGTGQFTIYGAYRHQLVLNGVTLSCPDGPAINNQCHKKCYVVLNGNNYLADGATYATSAEDRKAAFFSEGQMLFSGSGTLTVTGNYKHALASDDYIRFAQSTGTLTLSAASDGIHANDGLYFDGGSFTINAGADGIQCDTASIEINGGNIDITNAGDKGIIAFADITVNGGTIQINSLYKCLKAGKKENNTIVSAGNITVNGGDIRAICTGSSSGNKGGWGSSSDDTSTPEAIEAKGTITINGGNLYAQSSDDAINSAGDFTVNGGAVCAYSTGNDGLDANGNMYVKGGLVYAICAGGAEVALDANTEGGKKLYVSGGTIVAVGGLERGASLTQNCYSASSWSKNTWYALTVGDDVFAFKTPASGGTQLVVSGSSTPTLKSGVSASGTDIFNGMGYYPATVTGGSSVSLSAYSGGNSGGGPGGGGRH